jgi:hypothetical protein
MRETDADSTRSDAISRRAVDDIHDVYNVLRDIFSRKIWRL